MLDIKKCEKLNGVCYDIRGPVLQKATQMESEGQSILKLNTGNPAAFGFEMPSDMIKDVVRNIGNAQGYCESKGLYSARVAIYQHYQNKSFENLDVDHIYIGNGVSELIQISTLALLNNGDEVLIPAPDYPLWTASVKLAGGEPVHYRCDESQNWAPDIEDIERKITARTRAIVVINPNNPTGAVYKKEHLSQIVELARKHNLLIYSDEIYEQILYDDAEHISIGSLAEDLPVVTFNGLAKTHRAAGFRMGWMTFSGNKSQMGGYFEGLDILASMRLCANVPCQYAIQQALGGIQSIDDLTTPGGRLYEQRQVMWEGLNAIDGISCTKPEGALYGFAKVDMKKFNIKNDEQLIFDILAQTNVLMVHGRAFNWFEPDHFRMVFLPHKVDLIQALDKMSDFFNGYTQ